MLCGFGWSPPVVDFYKQLGFEADPEGIKCELIALLPSFVWSPFLTVSALVMDGLHQDILNGS
jgi:hypothetical protein